MTISTVTAQQANQWLNSGEAILIDVRNPDEFAAAHIPGALSIPLGQLTQTLAAYPLPTGQRLLFQCKGGKRGSQACTLVQNLKSVSNKVYNLEDGLAGWSKANLPVISTPSGISIFRQVQITVGGLIALCVAAGFLTSTPTAFVAAGLLGTALAISGVSGWCGMALLLARMPWNRT